MGEPARSGKPDSPAVFLAYPFRSREDWIRRYVSAILPKWGYAVNEGSHFEGLQISDAVCRAIANAQAMVAFVTKYRKLAQEGWAASDWVLEEIGFARGKGVPVIVIVERGVDVNLGILSDIQRIDLDPKAPYHALIRLRLALKSTLPNTRSSDEIRVEHIARPTVKVSGKQWWDFWIWLDAPPHILSRVDSVSYRFPSSFKPTVEVETDRDYGFGNWGDTDEAFELRLFISAEGRPRQRLSHKVTLF